MTETDQPALAYMARRDVSPQWRGFLQSMLPALAARLPEAERDTLLRETGERLAAAWPLDAAETLEGLEHRMNEALAGARWGHVALRLDAQDRTLRFLHGAAPCIPLATDPTGAWIGPVLEGLYAAWLSAQPGGNEAGSAQVRLVSLQPGLAELAFGQ
jgi:hypothetical protein